MMVQERGRVAASGVWRDKEHCLRGVSRKEQPCPQLDSRRLVFRAIRERMCIALSQEKRMATHSSILAREMATVHGVTTSERE